MEIDVHIPSPPTAYYDERAEKAVLGSILEHPEFIPSVIEMLNQTSFYATAHQILFDTISKVYAEYDTVDCLLVNNKLNEDDLMNRVGGEYAVPDLMGTNTTSTPENVLFYAEIVRDRAYRRQMKHIGNQITALSDNLDIEGTDGLSGSIEQLVSSLTEHHRQGVRSVDEIAQEILVEIENRKEKRMEYSTGVMDLDILTAGLQMGELFIIAGRPSQGKTTLAAQIAMYQAFEKRNSVLFCTYEMSAKAIVLRMLAQDTEMSFQKLSTEVLDELECKQLAGAVAKLTGCPFYLTDAQYNLQQLKAHVKHMKSKYDIVAVFVDYITIIPADRKYTNQVEKITEYSVQLKAMAVENNICVVALSQLSRASEKRAGGRPILSDLRDSGAIEQAADVVLFVHRPGFYDEDDNSNLTMLYLDKQRNGPQGEIVMKFNGERFRLEDMFL